MNLLFLTRLFHPHIGGVEKHVYKLSQQLITQDHQVTVITTQHESSLDLESTHDGITVHRIPKATSLTKHDTFSWILNHRQLFHQADIIHIHDVFWWIMPLQFTRLTTPTYITFHGWEGKFPPSIQAKIARKLAEHGTKGNICVGDFISKWYSTTPDFVTYGATDQPPLEDGDPDRILVLGRLSTDVDIDLVLDGLNLIRHKFPHIKITFLGDGDAAWKAERIGKVLGFQPDFHQYLAQAHWVIASSYLSMLESMAAGRFVFSVYSNPLKKDYLTLHPMSKHFAIAYTPKNLFDLFLSQYHNLKLSRSIIHTCQTWALKQTWAQLTHTYLQLWGL